ncbi:hypothetical protein AC1659_12465 [Rhodococcus erythropolis]|uniref:hypothetical protein n=1 Tax=Rhodococcus erythropolis TaxID=1833 RepID=UPI001BA82269|nr:hypothetical protein [Rhodococcus erythropolis]MBS2990084.1 hypothetical protein [Rhodococcus erythropolis]
MHEVIDQPTNPIPSGYTDRDRALDADPRLEQLDGLVWHVVAAAVQAGVTDGNAAWALLKVAAASLVGYGRGSVTLADEVPTIWLLDAAHLEHRHRTVEGDTDTERWMRTEVAWDAITGPWLHWLDCAERGVKPDVPVRHRRGAAWAEAVNR